eukprot:4605792-Amphidinium_carterae.1
MKKPPMSLGRGSRTQLGPKGSGCVLIRFSCFGQLLLGVNAQPQGSEEAQCLALWYQNVSSPPHCGPKAHHPLSILAKDYWAIPQRPPCTSAQNDGMQLRKYRRADFHQQKLDVAAECYPQLGSAPVHDFQGHSGVAMWTPNAPYHAF